MTPTSIAAYLALFVSVGFVFLFANLLVGRFVRPRAPNAEKLEIYECGEPTIGSGFVQFDLRFYVVALLFLIFDVEVAFFFPWATVFGKANQLRDLAQPDRAVAAATAQLTPEESQLRGLERSQKINEKFTGIVAAKAGELGVENADWSKIAEPAASPEAARGQVAQLGNRIAMFAIFDILAFFGILMIGFFYVWRRGDLDWVRALSRERAMQTRRIPPGAPASEAPAVLSI